MERLEIKEEDKILIVAPHPDDECIGMGGFLALYAKQTDVWIISDGAQGRKNGTPEACVNIRKKELYEEMKFYGVNKYICFDYPDAKLTEYENCLEENSFKFYTKIFVVNENDISIDHRAVYRMTVNAIIKQRVEAELYQYEVTYPLKRITNYLDISNVVMKKNDGINYHKSQIAIFDYARTSIALNKYRATWVEGEIQYVEAFYKVDSSEYIGRSRGLIDLELQKSRMMYNIELLFNDALMNRGTLNKIFVNYQKIYIYGYGMYGKKVEKYFILENIDIEGIIDKNQNIIGSVSYGMINIISLNDYVQYKKETGDIVVIAVQDIYLGKKIKQELIKYRINCLTLEELLISIKDYIRDKGKILCIN